VKAAV
jgi:hypothetical protein